MHTAIIMDGSGRWAHRRGLSRLQGHRQGAEAVRRAVEAAPPLGIDALTLYAFSSDNWRRPESETTGLMELFAEFLSAESARCAEQGVRLTVIGRRDRLPAALPVAIEAAERWTAAGARLHLRIALDYSARHAMLLRARRWVESGGRVRSGPGDVPEVDLLIRTGGEQRLSDFLLWESAYAELLFLPALWPDFTGEDLAAAVEEFRGRRRRFGGLPKGYCGIPA